VGLPFPDPISLHFLPWKNRRNGSMIPWNFRPPELEHAREMRTLGSASRVEHIKCLEIV
jgi:hypothetical protein